MIAIVAYPLLTTVASLSAQVFAALATIGKAQSGKPAAELKNAPPFAGITSCLPVPVVVKPSSDDTYTIQFYGDAAAVKSLKMSHEMIPGTNRYDPNGDIFLHNEKPFSSTQGIGVVVYMPADRLIRVTNRQMGSFTAVSGFVPPVLNVKTLAGAGPTALGTSDTDRVHIYHGASSNLTVSGEVDVVEFHAASYSGGTASFNAIVDRVFIDVDSELQRVYIGGLQNVSVSGQSAGRVSVSNATCNLNSGSCRDVPPRAVEPVGAPKFVPASSKMRCNTSCNCRSA